MSSNPLIACEVNEKMQTALHLAVLHKHYEMAEAILQTELGLKLLNSVDSKKMTPLDFAKATKQTQIVLLLEDVASKLKK